MSGQPGQQQQPRRGVRSHAEVAEFMTARGYPMSRTRVAQLEQRALAKLSRDPLLAQYAADLAGTEQEVSP